MKPLYLRQEFFGSIVFNPYTAKYFNLDSGNTEELVRFLENKPNTFGEEIFNSLKYPVGHEKPGLVKVFSPLLNDKKISAPLKVFFNLTKRCNLYCTHCYNDSGNIDSKELPLTNIINTLRSFETHGIFKVTLAGGEPLFHPDIDALLTKLNDFVLDFSLITNGICINKSRAELLSACNNLRSITISLDGPTAETNDLVRGNKSFERSIKGITFLKQFFKGEVAVRITIMQSNVDVIHTLPSLVAGLGIREIKCNSINPYGRAKNMPQLLLSSEAYLAARNKLYESCQALGINLEVPAHKYQQDANHQVGLCKAGEETFEIDGDGSVYPCSFSFGRFLAGNVRTQAFSDILYNLQQHSINNPFCYECKGRGGKAEKIFGNPPPLLVAHSNSQVVKNA